MNRYLFTSESVSEGHPDKMCDQISDAILDESLRGDSNTRMGCETMASTGLIIVSGEMRTSVYIDFIKVVRSVVQEIGYNSSDMGFDYHTCSVISSVNQQSPDIALGVDKGGAGDQGLMFGYASNETEELMPMPILLAHGLTRKLSELRKNGTLSFLRPDSKSQVTVEYEDEKPVRIDTVVISTQHDPDITQEEIKEELVNHLIRPTLGGRLPHDDMKIFVNPTGRFVVGGPMGDCGLTGRKIIVDTYGGFGRHGGGAFSGKDPSKVDRSASYMARYIAKNLVSSGLCGRCEIQLAYAIGIAEPVSVHVNAFDTGKKSGEELTSLIRKNFDLTPDGIIRSLDLKKPIYQKTACYGHFGRSEFSWEKTDQVKNLV